VIIYLILFNKKVVQLDQENLNYEDNFLSLIYIMDFGRKNYLGAFFFHSIYAAILFALVFTIDDYLDSKYGKNKNIIRKGLIHSVLIFIISIVVLFILWFGFGWGTGWVPSKK